MTEPLVLVAASGLAREAVEAIREAGTYEPIAVLDDDSAIRGSAVAGIPVLGPLGSVALPSDSRFLVCAGAGRVRSRIVDRLAAVGIGKERYATVIHPAARLGKSVSIGEGSVVLAGAVATSNVRIGAHVVVMPNAVLTHDDVLDDFVTVCASVALAGNVHVQAAAYLGAGCLVRERLTVGAASTVGMGAVVVQDVPPGDVWAGNPARRLPSGAPQR